MSPPYILRCYICNKRLSCFEKGMDIIVERCLCEEKE